MTANPFLVVKRISNRNERTRCFFSLAFFLCIFSRRFFEFPPLPANKTQGQQASLHSEWTDHQVDPCDSPFQRASETTLLNTPNTPVFPWDQCASAKTA